MGLPMVGKLYVLSRGDPFYCGTRAQAGSGRPPEGDLLPQCTPVRWIPLTVVYETSQPCLDTVHRPADQSDEMRPKKKLR